MSQEIVPQVFENKEFVRRNGKVFNSFTPMVTAKGATVFFKAISRQQQISIEF